MAGYQQLLFRQVANLHDEAQGVFALADKMGLRVGVTPGRSNVLVLGNGCGGHAYVQHYIGREIPELRACMHREHSVGHASEARREAKFAVITKKIGHDLDRGNSALRVRIQS